MQRATVLPCVVFLLGGAHGAALAETADGPAVAEADRLWRGRAEGATGGAALPEPVDALIAACRKGLAASPESVDLRWRLMRALYFEGEHVAKEAERKRAIFDEGKRIGEETLAVVRKEAAARDGVPADRATPLQLVPRVKGRPEVVAAFYWAGVDWGKWALVFGKTAAVRQGAAGKIRDYATAVIALDPAFEDGGGYRVLGRLHHQTPFVPFLTGWASREEALKNLRLAVRVAPENFINRLYLAEAVHEYEPARRDEARRSLEALVAASPAPGYAVEDRRTQEEARALLGLWNKR